MAAQATQRSRSVWDDRAWHPLPRLRGRVDTTVCVVGLGGSGLAAVGELLDRGVDVVGIDAGPVGGRAAGRNGGFLLAGAPDFHHRAAEYIGADRAAALYRLTLDQLDRMWLETPQAVRRTGSLRIATTVEELADCQAQLEAMVAAGIP
ncbi:MAG: FAD-dependent oxidoreductase, partial [Egibacteraceae bacterium]